MTTNEYLCGNPYPGRLIAAGLTPSGNLVYAYAIMGRSPNSRNRVFKVTGEEVYTKAFDESKVKDPSLIIYPAILGAPNAIIVANGDQSLNIQRALKEGRSLQSAIGERTFEPDAPNYTPRISLVIREDGFEFAINRRDGEGECERRVWSYKPKKGVLHMIHTYDGDGDPLPSFSTDPVELEVQDSYAEVLWNSLDRDNRISLYVKEGPEVRVFNAREDEKP